MILLIDNYDSFTYNLFQVVGAMNPDIRVVRNDKMTADEILALHPSHIILSPGPGFPAQAGICEELIQKNTHIPLLGVCLGHQAIGDAFGGKIVHAPRIMHGKSDRVTVSACSPLFSGMDEKIEVGRYHSLVIDREAFPEALTVTAQSDDGCVMAVQHKTRPVFGIQFHPESVLTPCGGRIIENFLQTGGGNQ